MSVSKLQLLAETANETKNASFSITRTKDRVWKVTLINIYDRVKDRQMVFADKDLVVAVTNAIIYIQGQRKIVEYVPLKFEL
jgi:hypothetical protein